VPGFEIVSVIFILLLVCFSAYVFIRFGLRPMARPGGDGRIKIREKIPLDHRGSTMLLLVQAGEKLLLLGVSQGNVSLLKEISEEELAEIDNYYAAETEEGGSQFSRLLKKFYDPK